MNVYSSSIHNCQERKITQIFSNWQMGTRMVVYLYQGKPLSNKEQWTLGTCNHLDASQRYHLEWKKSVSENYILWDALHIAFCKRQNHSGTEHDSDCQGLETWERMTTKGEQKMVFWVLESVLYPDCGGWLVMQTNLDIKTHRILHTNFAISYYINFTIS